MRTLVPRGLLGRTVVAAALVSAVVVGAGAYLVRDQLYYRRLEATEQLAAQQATQIIDVTLSDTRLAGDFGPLPYQLVGSTGVLVSGSTAFTALGAGTAPVMPIPPPLDPSATTDRVRITFPQGPAPLGGQSLIAVGQAVLADDVRLDADSTTRPGDLPDGAVYQVWVVVTADDANAAVEALDPFLVLGWLLTVLLVAGAAGLAVRRSLRPVEAIRARTASVAAGRLSERVPVPDTGDEIHALAVTVNETLDRLEAAAADQRRFLADAAHELRSPLTVLSTELQVAAAYPEAADWSTVIEQSIRSTGRLQLVVEDLLLLARLDAGPDAIPGEVVRIGDLISDALTDTPRPDITTVTGDTSSAVTGSRRHLHRMVRNILDNAARHALSSITVTVRLVDPADLLIDIHDDGPGVPVADRERVFDRFTRLDSARARDRGGSGLGLAIARDIAERHNGSVVIVESQNPGTTVRITLPL